MGAPAIFAPAGRLVRYALDLMHRKPLTIDAWEGFRTSDFDGRIKSGIGEYGPSVSLIRFLPKAHRSGRPSMSLASPRLPFQNSKSILFKDLARDDLTR